MQSQEERERTLWCGNLSEEVTESLLYELFIQAGPLQKVTIPKSKDGRKCTFGFVTFKDAESVLYARALMEGIALFNRTLRMEMRSGIEMPNPYLEALTQYQQSLPSVQNFGNVRDRLGNIPYGKQDGSYTEKEPRWHGRERQHSRDAEHKDRSRIREREYSEDRERGRDRRNGENFRWDTPQRYSGQNQYHRGSSGNHYSNSIQIPPIMFGMTAFMPPNMQSPLNLQSTPIYHHGSSQNNWSSYR